MVTEEKKSNSTEDPVQPEPESNQSNSEELLDLENNQAVYARFLLAQGANAEKIPDLLDPTKQIVDDDIQHINLDNIDYDPIVSPLSLSERHSAWDQIIRDRGFDEAYSRWSGGVLGSIIQTTDKKRLAVISHFLGKDTGFEQSDIDNLYDSFCRKGSKITDFVNQAHENPDLDFSEIEWLARKLFGKNSGKVTHRLLEMKASLKSDHTKTVQDLFYKDGNLNLDRINNPTEEEKEILGLLSQNFEKPRTGAQVNSPQQESGNKDESTVIGKPVFANPEEKIKAYEEAIESVKSGDTPIDPATGKSFTSKGSRDKDIEYLNERINDLRNYLESIKENDKTPSEIEKSGDLLFIRSRIILTVKKSNERYYVNILDEYASGDKKDEDRYLILEPLEEGISSDKMTKKDLLVKILGENPDYEFDPLEGSRIKVSGDDGDEYCYVRTYFQPRDIDERNQGEYIRLFTDFANSNENRIEEMPRSQFEEEILLKKIEIINESNGNKNSISTTPPPPESSEVASGAPAETEETKEADDKEVEVQQNRTVIDEIDESDLPPQPTPEEFAGFDEDETHGSLKADPEVIKPEEPEPVRVLEVNLSESENLIEDLSKEMSDEAESLRRKVITISPTLFRDEIISKWANIVKNTGKILPPTDSRPNEVRLREVEWEEEPDRRVNLTIKNRGHTKEIMVRRDSTRIPGRRSPVKKPAMELEDFYEKLSRWVNSLSKDKNWKLYRADVVGSNIVLNLRRK